MMKKISIVLTLLLCAIQICFAQKLALPSLPTGWERIYIKDVGSFDLPPTLEIQSGNYKQMQDEIYKRIEYDVPQLVAQQTGLNELGKEGYQKYARVMIETTFGSTGEFLKLNFNITTFTKANISELDTIYKQQAQQGLIGGSKLIEWYPLKIEKVNGMSCIHISYKRQLLDRPFVLVHIYYFHNNDRMHILTLSYRLSELDYWKSDYLTILKSFRITNIR